MTYRRIVRKRIRHHVGGLGLAADVSAAVTINRGTSGAVSVTQVSSHDRSAAPGSDGTEQVKEASNDDRAHP